MALGAQPSAWVTPAQAQNSTVITPTPGQGTGPQLNLAGINCSGQSIKVNFVLTQVPDGASAPGSVSYTLNGDKRSAALTKTAGKTAQYSDTIPESAQPTDSIYTVSSATATVTVSGGTLTASLRNPGTFTVKCRRPRADNGNGSGNGGGACQAGPVRETVGPGGQVQLSTCQWTLIIPAGALPNGGTVVLAQLSPAVSTPPRAGEAFFGQHIEVTLLDGQGNIVPQPQFTTPVVLCVGYSADDLVRVGNVEGFVIELFDTATASWRALPTTLDPANNSVCAALPHFSLYALASRGQGAASAPQGNPTPTATPVAVEPTPAIAGVQSNIPASLPNTGEQGGQEVPVWVWVLIGLTIGFGTAVLVTWRLKA
jgi:hypothetical protein